MNRKTGVLLSYVLMIFEVLSTLLLTPFIIRTLGQAEYGVYKLAASINAYLLLLDLGVGNAVTRYIAKFRVNHDKEREKEFLGVVTIFYVAIGFIALIIGFIFTIIFPHAFAKGLSSSEIALGQRLLIVSMINTAVTLATTPYNNVLIAYERFDVSKGSSIFQIIIRMGVTYIVLRMGLGSVGIVSVNLVLTILLRVGFVFFSVFKLQVKPCFNGFESDFVKEVVAYSSLILLQMIATQINSSVDQILIGSIVANSSTILAVYGVGTQIVQYYRSIGSAFTGVLMPGVVKMVESKRGPKELTNEMVRIGRIILMVIGLIWGVFLVNGKEFIILWAGAENEEAYLVSIILMSAYMLVLTEAIGTQILWAMNEHKEQAYIKLFIVVANVFLTIILIKWKPLLGATIGTFISIMLGDVGALNLVFVKKIKIKLSDYYLNLLKGIAPSVLIMISSGYLIRLFSPMGWMWFFIKIFAMILIYIICMYVIGLNHYERDLFKNIINKICKKAIKR